MPPPPPPVPQEPGAVEPRRAAPSPPEPTPPAATAPEPAPPAGAVPGGPTPPDPTRPEPLPAAGGPLEPEETGIEGLLEPVVEVPADFARLVRRTRKHLLRSPETALIEAYNRFVAALNGGQDEEELEDLGDDLEDAYFESRSRSGY